MNCASNKNAKKSSKEADRPPDKGSKMAPSESVEMEETKENSEEETVLEPVVPVIHIDEIGESTDEVTEINEQNSPELTDEHNEADTEISNGENKINMSDTDIVGSAEKNGDGISSSSEKIPKESLEKDIQETNHSTLKPSVKFVIDDDGEDDGDNEEEETHSVNYEDDSFTKYVNRMSLDDALGIAFMDKDKTDIHIGEELFVQYLKRHDKKHLKMALRPALWNIKHEIRARLWFKICHYLYKVDDEDIFTEFAEELFPNGGTGLDLRIPSFVDPCHLHSYHLTQDGIAAAKKILCVLEHSCPDIIHSPMLFSLLALFLHYMDVSQSYNCVYGLLRTKEFLMTTKVSYEASKFVIRDLAKKYAKAGFVNIVRNCGNIDQVFDSWMWWILEDLPLPYLVHVIDCYLNEGIKVFYRVALAILIQFQKVTSKKSPSGPKKDSHSPNVVTSLRQFCREMPVTVERLLKTGFGIRGLTRKEIRKLQVKHEMYITSTKNIANYNDRNGPMPLSRSFSGPIVLQNLGTNMLTPDMPTDKEKLRARSVGSLHCRPKIEKSSTLNESDLYAIWTWLPVRYAVCQPELLYTSEEHGTSLVTLYQRVENHQPTIIVIKTTNDEVFGAFCSTYWANRRQKSQLLSYFGTGETFIFTLYPEKKKYEWVGLTEENILNTANMFQAGDRNILTIGGGHGEAIFLDENMLHCRTEKCDTFNNPPLSSNEDFNCKVVEVYGFQQ